MAEFTQEQLDKMLEDAKLEARKGLFTEEDLTKRVTAEVDRRVESGIQKGLETNKSKWEQEIAERAKLSAEELAKKDFEEKQAHLTAKEREIQKKANKIDAKDMLSEANVPKSHYDKFIDMLVSDDPEVTKTNVQNFVDLFNSTKTEIETSIKSKLSNIPNPKQGDGDKAVTKADFIKMGYAEKIKFKTDHPDLYKEFIK